MTDSFSVVALYTGLNAFALLILALNVGFRRDRQNAFDPGATGDAQLTRAQRAHGNFIENAPIALAILIILALCNTSPLPLHILGGGFTLGRILHALGMMRAKHPNALRFAGNILTWLVLLVGGGLCVLRFYEALR